LRRLNLAGGRPSGLINFDSESGLRRNRIRLRRGPPGV